MKELIDNKTLIADIRRVAQKLGRPITRSDYLAHGKHSTSTMHERFGSWTKATAAAGNLMVGGRRIKTAKVGPKTVVTIGDVHFPFESQAVLAEVLDYIELTQPDVVVQLGDLYDLYSFGRFPRSHNIYTPQMELDVGRHKAELFWSEVRKRAPDATLYQIWGNHDDRAVKRIFEKSPEHAQFVQQGMKDLMTFDGVTTTPDSREELEIDGVFYIHGYRARLGDHARFNMRNTVCAHIHLGGVAMIKLEDKIVWELNSGWVGNRFAASASYTAQRRMSRWTTGLGQVDPNGPRFIAIDVEGKDSGVR